jgi:hypothetical protein
MKKTPLIGRGLSYGHAVCAFYADQSRQRKRRHLDDIYTIQCGSQDRFNES